MILPGSTIGVLGSGQLGRMFAIAARRMGYRVHTFSPETDTPTGQVSDLEISASYDDLTAIEKFAKAVNVITFEFENVPTKTVEAAERFAPVRPSGHVLHIAQHRLREKTFLKGRGFPITPFQHVASQHELECAIDTLGTPAVLKTAGFGYDGKGQQKLNIKADAKDAFQALNVPEAVLEAFVDFDCELSVITARGLDQKMVSYPVFENAHSHHILDITVCPARISSAKAKEAIRIAEGIMETLDVVGVLCVEFFLTRKGKLLVNELAPRPHNSGHLTFDACVTSQFEQQLRAVCGLPLGSPTLLRPAAAMANLLGDQWSHGTPQWTKALSNPEVKLHLYGKSDARPGRKMGHFTAMAKTPTEAHRLVAAARAQL